MPLLRKALLLLLVVGALYVATFLLLSRVEVGGTPLIYRVSEVFHWKGGDTWQRFHEFDRTVRNDVVVIGSSRAYRGYDPAHFADRGLRMFNLGSSGQTALNAYFVVEAYLDSANTGLLVLEVSRSFLMSDGLESTCDLVQNIEDDRAARRMAMTLRDPRALNLLALRYVMQDRLPMYKLPEYAGQGYCRFTNEAKVDTDMAPGEPFEPDPEQLKYLRELIDLCRDRGLALVLVTHPEPRSKDPEKQLVFRDLVADQLHGTGVRHVDLGLDHDLNDRVHFADRNHLNQAGVDRFLPLLLDSLEVSGMLPDRSTPLHQE